MSHHTYVMILFNSYDYESTIPSIYEETGFSVHSDPINVFLRGGVQ